MARPPMSMEAYLDEERREVLALLEGTTARNKAPSTTGARSPSPYNYTRSPVRSMLDFGDEPSPPPTSSPSHSRSPRPTPIRSMLDFDAPPPAQQQVPIRSMLDVDSPPPSAAKSAFSAQTSPTDSIAPRAHSISGPTGHPRSLSDAAARPVDFGPRAPIPPVATLDPTAGYQFSGIITHNSGGLPPKRVAQGSRRPAAMAEVVSGRDVNSLLLPGERSRHYPTGGSAASGASSGAKSAKSKSPRGRLGVRSSSPASLLAARRLSPAGRALLEDNQGLDMQNAYRRLSDANLARSGGSLSVLSRKKKSNDANASGRLAKDYLSPDGDLLPEDSSDDNGGSSSEDEGERGRKAARNFDKAHGSDSASIQSGSLGVKDGTPDSSKRRPSHSLLAAAEEERLEVAASQPAYQYRSLLDEPQITVTNPAGERAKHIKQGIHPATSFDNSGSGTRTPMDSDEEADFSDIKRAQKLSFAMTPIMSSGDAPRSIRIIYRGEFAKVSQDAVAEHRRLKKYLVATDLSEESTHALEWTVGTVLRDGDTLIALDCVDEETGIMPSDSSVLAADEPRAMREQAAALSAVASLKTSVGLGGGGSSDGGTGSGSVSTVHLPSRPSPLVRAVDLATVSAASESGISPAPSSRERSKAEEDRERVILDITDRITKLLRKTRLQVRVVIEVIHCKNPKHLITEVIDHVNPTLVILGSRGRSALKGVILGSFSNYLVTKSSVPVMVARKRLRKQSKYKRTLVPQVNNLTNPTARSLASAKVD